MNNMMNNNAFRFMLLMFIAAVVMNAMNYFFCSLQSVHRPIPVRDTEKKFIILEKKDKILARVGKEMQSESTMLNKLMGISAGARVLSTGLSSASDYDTTTDSLTTTSIFGTMRVESSSQFVNNVRTGKWGSLE